MHESPRHEDLQEKLVAASEDAAKVDSLEDWNAFAEEHLFMIEEALSSSDETEQEVAKLILEELASTLNSDGQWAKQVRRSFSEHLEPELSPMSQEVRELQQTLSSLSEGELQSFFKENLRSVELTYAQKTGMHALDVASKFIGTCLSHVTSDAFFEGPLRFEDQAKTTKILEELQRQLSVSYAELFSNPEGEISTATTNKLYDFFANPKMTLGLDFPPINIREIKDINALTSFETTLVAAMEKIGFGIGTAKDIASESLSAELEPRREKIKKENEKFLEDYKTRLRIKAYAGFDEHKDQITTNGGTEPTDEYVRSVIEAMVESVIEDKVTQITLNTEDTTGIGRTQEEMWEAAKKTFNHDRDEAMKQVAKEVGIFMAMSMIPGGFVATRISSVTKALLVGKIAQKVPQVAELIKTLFTGKQLLRGLGFVTGVMEEAAINSLASILSNPDIRQIVDGNNWIKNLLIDTALDGILGRGKMKNLSSVKGAKVITSSMSAEIGNVGDALLENGEKRAFARLTAESIKRGKFHGNIEDVMEFCGPEIHELLYT